MQVDMLRMTGKGYDLPAAIVTPQWRLSDLRFGDRMAANGN